VHETNWDLQGKPRPGYHTAGEAVGFKSLVSSARWELGTPRYSA
jgi:hypothetical protein